MVTTAEGTAAITLRPGHYTVESVRPVPFQGKAYQWSRPVAVAAGRDVVLELNIGNADVVSAPITAEPVIPDATVEEDPAVTLLKQWQPSIVSLWTPTTYASGFVVDAQGLIATSQKSLGSATSVEVQLTPAVKVAGSLVVADAASDVAILRIDPKTIASIHAVPLGCALPSRPAIVEGQEILAIGAAILRDKIVTVGVVNRAEPRAAVSDLAMPGGSTGGPVFASGAVVGITTIADDQDGGARGDTRVVRIDDVCAVLDAAQTKIKGAAAPSGTHLPVEPAAPLSLASLKDAAASRTGPIGPYQMSSSDFDIAFVTPLLTYDARQQLAREEDPRNRDIFRPDAGQAARRALVEFGNWSEYMANTPRVLAIRVTPKLVEGFWTTVARGAAETQGMSLPPIKHVKTGFARCAFCGSTEVAPSPVQDRAASLRATGERRSLHLRPPRWARTVGRQTRCSIQRRNPKADSRPIDPKLLQQIFQDFIIPVGSPGLS